MAILSRVSEILPISSEVDVKWVHSKAYQPPLVPAVHFVSSDDYTPPLPGIPTQPTNTSMQASQAAASSTREIHLSISSARATPQTFSGTKRPRPHTQSTPEIITDCLPRVIAHRDFFKTSELDEVLGIPPVAPRVMRAIVFKKLNPITNESGPKIVKPFLETIQCHALLWWLGIRHGDISDTNLMVDPATGHGVLNDFDLATVVDPDSNADVPVHGNDRTGTLPFMALDLLTKDGLSGKIPRKYRHDLESFCWVFFWICYCYDDGKESIRYPCSNWINCTPGVCFDAKMGVGGQMGSGLVNDDYMAFTDVPRRLAKFWVHLRESVDESVAQVVSDNTEGRKERKWAGGADGKYEFLERMGQIMPFTEPPGMKLLNKILGILPESPEVEMEWISSEAYQSIN